MPKTRTTVTLEEEVFRAVKIKAARTGKRDSQVIEEALRRDLGMDVEDLWARVTPAPEAKSLALANAEVHAMRRERRAAGRS
jgi:gamma-glutamyl:cysteine ligase YbdK (ATP-grasp superfamily)